MKWITLFLLSTSLLFGESEEEKPQVANIQINDKRENYFQTATPYKITPHVNPITGDLMEEEADLVVAGIEPLSVRRFYNHLATYEPRYGGWRYNPETFLVANFEWSQQECFAAAGDEDGTIVSLHGSTSQAYTFVFDQPQNTTNFSGDGQSHPLNTKLTYFKRGDPKNKKRFSWEGSLIDGSGKKRFFQSHLHKWHDHVDYTKGRKTYFEPGTKSYYRATPNVWTPYQIPIQETRLPNGNILCFSYVRWKEDRLYPTPPLINTIAAYNSDKTQLLASITFSYCKDKGDEVRGAAAKGSDGRQIRFEHQGNSPLLTAAHRVDQPLIIYSYNGQNIIRLDKPEGRVVTTEYNSANKVSAQYAPVGPNGEMHPIGRYVYHTGATEVYDAQANKVIYRYNDRNQILSLDTYQNDTLYRIDRFSWDSNGNLLKKTIEDAKGNVLQTKEYKYDKNHNPIEEKTGEGNEWHTIYRIFSEDGFNLKLSESDRPGRIIRYDYVPQTNLKLSELFYEGDVIRKRIFHTYNNAAVCIKTVTDDGTTTDPNNLQGVTYRTLTEIQPRQCLPCYGLPEIVQEKTVNSEGEEILLKKICYTYTPCGKVAKEEHYDSNNCYCYSLLNEYDEKERLISKTDALGHKTTFTYDDNFNLSSTSGPRHDQHQEITYDKANRPIRIVDWQTDGSLLVTEKKYNKLGQVIAEIDPCGNTIRFEYDALGRCTAVIHPDNGVERREYNVLDHITKEINPLGQEICKTYNFKGQPLSIKYPDGSEEYFTYFTHGPVATHTDKNGAKTIYTLDIFDNPIKAETYSQSGKLLKVTSASYSPFRKLSETDGKGITTLYTYDFAGRKIAEQKDYSKRHFTYDSLGRVEQTQEEEITTLEKRDFLGQIIEKRTETDKRVQFQEKYLFDPSGNCIQTINSQGIHTTEYNTDGKPLSTTDRLGSITQFNYSYDKSLTETTTNPHHIQTIQNHDSKGRNSELLKKNSQGETIQQSKNSFDQNDQRTDLTHTVFDGTQPIKTITHHWDYGPMGRVERVVESAIKQIQYLYDSRGRVQTIITPKGDHLNHEYDDLGRLSRYFSHDFDYHYTYDLNDQLLIVYDSVTNTKTERTYDTLNNIILEELAHDLAISNTFDTHNRKASITLPDHSTIAYSYDGAYLYQVGRNGNTHTYAERNLEGELLRSILPGDLGDLIIQRDVLGRWKKVSTPFYTTELIYDAVGNLIQNDTKDNLGGQKLTYTFDDLDQLITEEGHTYHFDSLYNRLSKNSSEHEVNTLCQITHDGHTPYLYDANGNLISDQNRKFVYDSQDRLIAIEENNKRIEYAYDPFHRRLWKKVWINGQQISYDRYLWDGNNEIGVVDENGTIQELRILGEGLGAEIGAAVLFEMHGKTYVPLHDIQGSVITLIDLASKEPIECYRYTAYGQELTNNTLSSWRFSSKRVDETDLIYFGRRYYSSELGRWITADPVGFKSGPNLYAYLLNAPLTDIDLYGLHSFRNNFDTMSYKTFKGLEWTGANLIPVPIFRGFVESIGRWGAGGDLFGSSRYRFNDTIIPIEGRTIPHHSYTHGNGILTSNVGAKAQGQYISETHGNVHVDVLYKGTQGFIMDLFGSGLSKLGIPSSYNKMCANYYHRKMQEDQDHFFTSSVHSRGGTELMNTGKMIKNYRQRIDVIAYGSSTLIPNGYFKSAENNLSWMDVVTMTNPLAFGVGLISNKQYNINFLSPLTGCPFKAHGFLESTYAERIAKKGREFKALYFNE